MTRKEIAAARMKAASEHVEAAQHELERAVSALAALKWMYPEQRKVEVLRDRIHEAFYRLAPLSHARAKACAKAELDREPEPGDEEPHKGCCVGYRPAVVPFDDAYEKRKREHEAAGDGSDGREIAARNPHGEES